MIIALNAVTGGISEWTLPWVSVADLSGSVFGMTATALEVLGGDAEPDFSGEFRTGDLNFGTLREKNASKFYLDIHMPEAVTLYTACSERGATTEHPYPLAVRDTDALDNSTFRREPLARGLRGPWWAFGVSGADFSIGQFDVFINTGSRRG